MMHLRVKDLAPAFSAKDQDGNTVSLTNFKGRKLVLFFYPRDNTPGCTVEACNLRDNYAQFIAKGYALLGVSNDDETKHLKFIKKYELPFPLLADIDKVVVNAYGVYAEKKIMGKTFMGINRTTFVIDENGLIETIITDVKTKDHTAQILD